MGSGDEWDDEESWEVEVGDRRLVRPVESAPARGSHRALLDRGRTLRVAAVTAAVALALFVVPAAVRWARDSLAEITQSSTTTTTAPVTGTGG